MYKILFIFFLTVSCRELKGIQAVNGRELEDELKNTTEVINQRETHEKDELKKLQVFGDAYAKEMNTWSEEYRNWFVENFFYVRGQIKIPNEPMTPPPPKY